MFSINQNVDIIIYLIYDFIFIDIAKLGMYAVVLNCFNKLWSYRVILKLSYLPAEDSHLVIEVHVVVLIQWFSVKEYTLVNWSWFFVMSQNWKEIWKFKMALKVAVQLQRLNNWSPFRNSSFRLQDIIIIWLLSTERLSYIA